MTRLFCAVSILALALPGTAVAQQGNNAQSQPSSNRPARPPAERPNQRPSQRPSERPNQGPNHGSNQRPPSNRPSPPSQNRPGHPSTRPPTFRPGSRPSSFRRFRAPPFRYPHGWRYRRWSTGSILPHLFLSHLYFWTNWAALGLGPPPPGFVWVRFGPDLLLVDRRTGRIADVIYDAFY